MKTLKMPKQSRTVEALLDQAREEDIVVKAEDGTQFLIQAIDEFDREIVMQRANKKLMAFLDQCAKETEWTSLTKVEKTLRLPPRTASKKKK